jgi:hypothetical protein
VDREAAAFASDLWRTIPTQSQNAIRRIAPRECPDAESLRGEVIARAARAGYVVDGSLAVAVRALGHEHEALREMPSSPAAYAEACAACPPFAAVIALVFDDACLAARGTEA